MHRESDSAVFGATVSSAWTERSEGLAERSEVQAWHEFICAIQRKR